MYLGDDVFYNVDDENQCVGGEYDMALNQLDAESEKMPIINNDSPRVEPTGNNAYGEIDIKKKMINEKIKRGMFDVVSFLSNTLGVKDPMACPNCSQKGVWYTRNDNGAALMCNAGHKSDVYQFVMIVKGVKFPEAVNYVYSFMTTGNAEANSKTVDNVDVKGDEPKSKPVQVQNDGAVSYTRSGLVLPEDYLRSNDGRMVYKAGKSIFPIADIDVLGISDDHSYIRLYRDGRSETLRVSEISSSRDYMKRVSGQIGSMVDDTTAKIETQLINRLIRGNEIKRIVVSTAIGWNQTFTEYTTPNSKITKDGERDSNDNFTGVNFGGKSGSLAGWIDAINGLNSLKERPTGLIFSMYTAFASTLIRPLDVENIIFHTFCESGRGKTISAKTSASIFGNPSNIISRWNSTKNYLLLKVASYESCVSIIDELSSRTGDKTDSLGTFIYSYSEGSGKGTASRSGREYHEPPKYKGAMITFGEIPIRSDQALKGAVIRACQSKVTPFGGIISPIIVKDFESQISKNYGHALSPFLVEFLNNREKYEKMILNPEYFYDSYTSLMKDKDSDSLRLIERCLPVAIAGYICNEAFGFSFDVKSIFTEMVDSFLVDSIETGSIEKRAIDVLIEDFQMNPSRYRNLNFDGTSDTDVQGFQPVHGYYFPSTDIANIGKLDFLYSPSMFRSLIDDTLGNGQSHMAIKQLDQDSMLRKNLSQRFRKMVNGKLFIGYCVRGLVDTSFNEFENDEEPFS